MTHTRNSWTQSHHKDGDQVILYRLDWKAQLARAVVYAVDELDEHVFRHALCGNVEWMHRVPLGLPRYDPDPEFSDMLTNSLGSVMSEAYGKLINWEGRVRDQHEVARVKISKQLAAELWPAMAWLILDNEE